MLKMMKRKMAVPAEHAPALHTETIDGIVRAIGYKVVTRDMKSLGLRRNPNILTYKLGEWYFLPESEVHEGPEDWGGIWVARALSGATTLQKYMKSQYNRETRIFKSAIDSVLYHNSYRTKTNGVLLLEEIARPK